MYRLLKRLTINMIATMLEPEETMELQVCTIPCRSLSLSFAIIAPHSYTHSP